MKRIVTAIFETRAEARRARDALRAIGVPAGSIALHSKAEHDMTPATDAAPGSEPWLPSLLDLLFRPDPNYATHHAALEQGAVAVTARVAAEIAPAAAEALETAGGRYTRNATEPVAPTS
ncbi:hypothetical protein DFH01_02670 [Falsiroseomonas bella]|uniref:Uncharacterized protein n=1 Tax=Falsiroseomonas bella TaxID=2184016 RepID=A0A317FGM8_9PROT|nr:hypothetical protein [Falsiroseomonas bella]PWS38221.1 hypothetical protein DFH01_02670 [Falsiroseomonas bella]